MGLKGVLKKAYERGQFRKLAEFYIMWAKVRFQFEFRFFFLTAIRQKLFCIELIFKLKTHSRCLLSGIYFPICF